MEISRRNFLKATGVTVTAVAAGCSFQAIAGQGKANFTVTGIEPGSSVGLIRESDNKLLCAGKASSDTVEMWVDFEEKETVILRIRKAGYKFMDMPYDGPVSVNVQQEEDTAFAHPEEIKKRITLYK